jgi:hypothetical protein
LFQLFHVRRSSFSVSGTEARAFVAAAAAVDDGASCSCRATRLHLIVLPYNMVNGRVEKVKKIRPAVQTVKNRHGPCRHFLQPYSRDMRFTAIYKRQTGAEQDGDQSLVQLRNGYHYPSKRSIR